MRRTSRTILTLAGVLAAWQAGLGAPARLAADWHYDLAEARWVRTEAADVDAEASDNQFARALEAYEKGETDSAEQILEGWLRFYRARRDCQSAMFLLGETRRLMGHYMDAYQAYEQLLDAYAATPLFDHVLGLETDLAKAFLDGRKQRALKVFKVGAKDEAQEMLERIFQRDPRGARGRAALLMLADYHFKAGEFGLAEDEYQRLADNFPADPQAGEFRLLAAQAALGRFRGVRHDARPLAEAEQRLEELKQADPDLARRENVGQLLEGIEQRKAEQDFNAAEFYKKTGRVKAAIYYYKAVARDYPNTEWARQSADRLVQLGVVASAAPSAAPQVSGVGVQGVAQVLSAGPLPTSSDGVIIAPGAEPVRPAGGTALVRPPSAGSQGSQGSQPQVLHAGPAPVLRGGGEGGVIDIGPATGENQDEMPIRPRG